MVYPRSNIAAFSHGYPLTIVYRLKPFNNIE